MRLNRANYVYKGNFKSLSDVYRPGVNRYIQTKTLDKGGQFFKRKFCCLEEIQFVSQFVSIDKKIGRKISKKRVYPAVIRRRSEENNRAILFFYNIIGNFGEFAVAPFLNPVSGSDAYSDKR